MSNVLYQAKVGDGFAKKSLLRKNSLFKTAGEAVSEALAIKESLDKKYKNKIQWDYNGIMSGSVEKVKILQGLLNGDKKTIPFYLQIVTVGDETNVTPSSPKKPQKISAKDKKVVNQAISFLK
ncbi:hypothetical protein NC661_03285 [Aquibacillus koreensis]|uniref:Uncharacterized protein n=1 Tax=Aquibacillus koreensis TaxID=279446 RepID=A0A9X3WL51_9BACI|nr:hypothetical protein [Aquibacillus koreensis]MCT2536528.1 hypothetical protein [Aquibacillus koreensis]MDC3419384.1 hypothetical protein [Aquibacillus koreensis]